MESHGEIWSLKPRVFVLVVPDASTRTGRCDVCPLRATLVFTNVLRKNGAGRRHQGQVGRGTP
jgi:hypothetical protein